MRTRWPCAFGAVFAVGRHCGCDGCACRAPAIALNYLLSPFEQASSVPLLVRSSSANVVFRLFGITFSDLSDIEEICSDMPGRMLVSLDREQLFA